MKSIEAAFAELEPDGPEPSSPSPSEADDGSRGDATTEAEARDDAADDHRVLQAAEARAVARAGDDLAGLLLAPPRSAEQRALFTSLTGRTTWPTQPFVNLNGHRGPRLRERLAAGGARRVV